MYLLALGRRHQDAHNTRLVQKGEYQRHYTTPDANIHDSTTTQSIKNT